jgi:hypothetical protein
MAGATYNITRFTRQVLKRYRKEPPSLVLHLYQTHFRFEQQVSVKIGAAAYQDWIQRGKRERVPRLELIS